MLPVVEKAMKKFENEAEMYHVFKVVTPVGDNKWEFNYWHLFLSDRKEGICTIEKCPNEFNCEDKTGWCRFLQVVDK